jgi:DNA-binding GntR family transcriptional regulator
VNDVPTLGAVERPETLGDQAYARIRQALMSGTLMPGEKVPLRAIAKALDVSLTPAREAIGRLAAERALELGPNRTVYVPKLTRDRYREIMEIRLPLEGLAAERACPRLGPERLQELERVHAAMIEAIDAGQHKTALKHNEAFHFGIYEAADRPLLMAMIESLWLQAGPTLNLLTPGYQRSHRGVRNHASALEALRRGDAAGVRAAIEKDLRDGARHLEPLLED